jgi:hypothetical protein
MPQIEVKFSHFRGLDSFQQSIVQGKEGDASKMQLSGCFEADKKVGRIKIKPFSLNIRSLNTDFAYVKKFKGLEESKKLIEFMKYHEATGSDPSKHLVDLVTDSFSEFKNQKNYKFEPSILNIV